MSKSNSNTAKTSKHIIVIVFVIVLGVLVFFGGIAYFAIKYLSKPVLTKEQQAVVELAKDIEVYPDAYISAGLPQYPNGELISLSKKTDTVNEGINVTVNTNDDLATIAKYYDDELVAKGWIATDGVGQISTEQYIKEYKKADQLITIFINPTSEQGYKNNVSVNWELVN